MDWSIDGRIDKELEQLLKEESQADIQKGRERKKAGTNI